MLLTLTTTHSPATDLGYLLAKHPARCQTFELTFGQAQVFYPEATAERCTAALLLELDPVALVRGQAHSREGGPLSAYVNDRPYVASSFLSVALSQVFGTALNGTCKERPELAATAIPLVARLPVVPCGAGAKVLRRLFEPLGYSVAATRLPLDERFPEWGESRYYEVELAATVRLSELLTHLYVLLPVVDDDKHYWVGRDEQQKLLARGEGWLASHPARDLIVERYLKHQRGLVRGTLAQLLADDDPDPETTDDERAQAEGALEERLSLNDQRLGAVLAVLRESGAQSVADLGCGEGKLLRALLKAGGYTRLTGLDVSHRALERAHDRLGLERLTPARRATLQLVQGSLTYRDARLTGHDAACAIEVIEHLDPSRLDAFERVVFGCAQPPTVIVTTPNVEYNARFESLPAGKLRHRDHRFEWTRAEFEGWAAGVAARGGYNVSFLPVGPVDPELGAPTQMGVFQRCK